MSWQTQNALKRVFGVCKRFQALKGVLYDNDIEALKTINTALENDSKAYVNDNKLYAKLLCFVLYKNVQHFGGIKQAIRHLQSDVLNFSLPEHIEMLRRHMNKLDFDEYLETLGLSETFTGDDEESNLVILTKHQNEIVTKLNKFWEYDKVKKSFYNTADQFLQDPENYI